MLPWAGWGLTTLPPAGGGGVLQEHDAAAGGRHLRGCGGGEVEPAQAHRSAHGHDGRSQARHVSGTLDCVSTRGDGMTHQGRGDPTCPSDDRTCNQPWS